MTATPDASSPNVPNAYDSDYSETNKSYFLAYDNSNTGDLMKTRGWNTWWRMIEATGDYAVGDTVDTVSFSSATAADSNIVFYTVLNDNAISIFIGASFVLGASSLI